MIKYFMNRKNKGTLLAYYGQTSAINDPPFIFCENDLEAFLECKKRNIDSIVKENLNLETKDYFPYILVWNCKVLYPALNNLYSVIDLQDLDLNGYMLQVYLDLNSHMLQGYNDAQLNIFDKNNKFYHYIYGCFLYQIEMAHKSNLWEIMFGLFDD